MAASLKKLAKEAQELSADDRARLAEVLLESLHEAPAADIRAAWEHEIAQRVAAYDRGETKTYAAEEVLAEARRLGR